MDPSVSKGLLKFQELATKTTNNIDFLSPPLHEFYSDKYPGAILNFRDIRDEQCALCRLISGLSRSLAFAYGSKVLLACLRYVKYQALPAHILSCLGLDTSEFYKHLSVVLDFFMRVND
ncbi:hypothetical protein AVEN_200922-1 [Araneus ventricosus]|uniref:Uncharacterized protein n=1 Tax=Araneus ventricosus TaxID=182803 RepID=A0A4Y2B951_ARAVE|nr:hypothetical protein AVEN_200922-1 [Araneus ventricosus]